MRTIAFYEINRMFTLRDSVMEIETDNDSSVIKFKSVVSEIYS